MLITILDKAAQKGLNIFFFESISTDRNLKSSNRISLSITIRTTVQTFFRASRKRKVALCKSDKLIHYPPNNIRGLLGRWTDRKCSLLLTIESAHGWLKFSLNVEFASSKILRDAQFLRCCTQLLLFPIKYVSATHQLKLRMMVLFLNRGERISSR